MTSRISTTSCCLSQGTHASLLSLHFISPPVILHSGTGDRVGTQEQTAHEVSNLASTN